MNNIRNVGLKLFVVSDGILKQSTFSTAEPTHQTWPGQVLAEYPVVEETMLQNEFTLRKIGNIDCVYCVRCVFSSTAAFYFRNEEDRLKFILQCKLHLYE